MIQKRLIHDFSNLTRSESASFVQATKHFQLFTMLISLKFDLSLVLFAKTTITCKCIV